MFKPSNAGLRPPCSAFNLFRRWAGESLNSKALDRVARIRRRDDRRSMPKAGRRSAVRADRDWASTAKNSPTTTSALSSPPSAAAPTNSVAPAGRARRASPASLRHICANSFAPTSFDQRRSMSATRSPAAAIASRPRLVRSISLARPSAGSGRRTRYPICFEVVDQLRRGGQAQLRTIRQLGEPHAAHPDVAEDLHVRVADVTESRIGARSGEVVRGTLAAASPAVARRPAGPSADLLTSPCRPEDTTVTEVSVSEVNGESMITPSPNFVSTDLGRLHVRRTGTGPPVVLWHSLFVDSRSWGTAGRRRWPATGRSTPSTARPMARASPCTVTSASRSASPQRSRPSTASASPNPSTGSATRGEATSAFASRRDSRLRTLTTIGTPVQAFTLGEKLTKGWPLVEMYRFTGADRLPLEAAVRLAARTRKPLRLNLIRRRRSSRRSPRPTATACCMPCGR